MAVSLTTAGSISGFGELDPEAGEKTNILIVDDLPEKLLVFETMLEELDQNLVFVRSGNAALREVLRQEFAVILLDVNMPDIDGFETAKLIRRYRRSAHTPIVFITAYADEMQTARGYALGAVDYIMSPVIPEVLRSKIRVFVELHSMQKRLRRRAEERVALAAAEAGRFAAEESTRRSNFLSQASAELGGSLDIDVRMRKLLSLVTPQLAASSTLVMRDEHADHDRLLSCTAGEPGAAPVFVPRRFEQLSPAAQLAFCRCLETRLPVALPPRPAPDGTPGVRAGTVLPLAVGERVLGALIVDDEAAGVDQALLEDLAARAAIAFENSRLYRSLEAELVVRRQAEQRLHDSNQRKDEFLAMLSHELRNPLAPIRNAIELIRRLAPADAKLTWATDVADRQVAHMNRLVEELLDVARISQGKIVLQMEPLDLLIVIHHAVETVRHFIDERKHALTLRLPDAPVWLRGDPARLSQVIGNLLNNSAKYTDEGGAIGLSLVLDNGEALLTVTDNGIGIEADLLPNVFELFEQGRRPLDRSQGGLGVGLTLVQRLVQLHNGSVDVSSRGSGLGAEFNVRLPCLREVKPVEEPLTNPPEVASSGGCRVLVVDDNRDAAETVALYLELAGHEVKTVGDGMQAMASAPVYAPDVVVLDIGLPGLDGYEVARRLRQTPQTRDALILALTGYGQKGDQQQAIDAGFDAHFVKPADPELLVKRIAEWRETAAGAPGASRREMRRQSP
ncbi:MAG: response regulator [Methylibium sp.]|nr:response regulator [Methylibium sp.]